MVYLSYKGGCNICECTQSEGLKEELAWPIDKCDWICKNLLSTHKRHIK